jgi:hypothetical protein
MSLVFRATPPSISIVNETTGAGLDVGRHCRRNVHVATFGHVHQPQGAVHQLDAMPAQQAFKTREPLVNRISDVIIRATAVRAIARRCRISAMRLAYRLASSVLAGSGGRMIVDIDFSIPRTWQHTGPPFTASRQLFVPQLDTLHAKRVVCNYV